MLTRSERISRGLHRFHERRKAEWKLRPRDLARLERDPNALPGLRPLLRIAAEESAALIEALGGLDRLSPAQRMLVEDLCAVGIALRSQVAFLMQSNDGDVAARVGSLTRERRASLAALGLGPTAREDSSLSDYKRAIAQAAQRGAKTNESKPQGDTPEDHSPEGSAAPAAGAPGEGSE